MTQIQFIPITPPKGLGDIPKLFVLLNNAVRDQVAEGVRFMSIYPAKPPGSTYTRRGKLRASWSFQVKTGGGRIEGTIGSNSNIAPYNRDVQGEDQQALFKRIGWKNVKDLEKKIDKEFSKRVDDMIAKAFR